MAAVEKGPPGGLQDPGPIGAGGRVEEEVGRVARAPKEDGVAARRPPRRPEVQGRPGHGVRPLGAIADSLEVERLAALERLRQAQHQRAVVALDRPGNDPPPRVEGDDGLFRGDLFVEGQAHLAAAADHLLRHDPRCGRRAYPHRPGQRLRTAPSFDRVAPGARVEVVADRTAGGRAVAKAPPPAVAPAGRRQLDAKGRLPGVDPEGLGREVDVGEAIGGRMPGHPARVPDQRQGGRVRRRHEDLVVGVDVAVLAVRGGVDEGAAVGREHREIGVAESVHHPGIALGDDGRDRAARQIQAVDRTAGAGDPVAPAAVAREVGLAAAERGALVDREAGAVVGRERGPAAGGEGEPGPDQPAVGRLGPLGQETRRARGQVEQPRPSVAVDEDELGIAPPHRGAVLEVGAGRGRQGGDLAGGQGEQEERSGGAARLVGLASGRQAEESHARAVRRQVRAAVDPARLVGRELSRSRAGRQIDGPDAPDAAAVGLPDHEAVPEGHGRLGRGGGRWRSSGGGRPWGSGGGRPRRRRLVPARAGRRQQARSRGQDGEQGLVPRALWRHDSGFPARPVPARSASRPPPAQARSVPRLAIE